MDIKTIMKPVKRCLSPNDALPLASRTLEEESVTALPVCNEDGSLAGLTTASAITESTTRTSDSSEKQVRDVMFQDDISCRETDDVAAIAASTAQLGRSCLAVLDEKGQLQGMADLTPYQGYSDRDKALDDALQGTFPASDPISPP